MPTFKIKPSDSSDVVGYAIYMKVHDPAVPITKKNYMDRLPLPKESWEDRGDGYLYYAFDGSVAPFSGLDGYYDFGIAAYDDATPVLESPLFSQGMINVGIDFVAPNPITEASIIFG